MNRNTEKAREKTVTLGAEGHFYVIHDQDHEAEGSADGWLRRLEGHQAFEPGAVVLSMRIENGQGEQQRAGIRLSAEETLALVHFLASCLLRHPLERGPTA